MACERTTSHAGGTPVLSSGQTRLQRHVPLECLSEYFRQADIRARQQQQQQQQQQYLQQQFQGSMLSLLPLSISSSSRTPTPRRGHRIMPKSVGMVGGVFGNGNVVPKPMPVSVSAPEPEQPGSESDSGPETGWEGEDEDGNQSENDNGWVSESESESESQPPDQFIIRNGRYREPVERNDSMNSGWRMMMMGNKSVREMMCGAGTTTTNTSTPFKAGEAVEMADINAEKVSHSSSLLGMIEFSRTVAVRPRVRRVIAWALRRGIGGGGGGTRVTEDECDREEDGDGEGEVITDLGMEDLVETPRTGYTQDSAMSTSRHRHRRSGESGTVCRRSERSIHGESSIGSGRRSICSEKSRRSERSNHTTGTDGTTGSGCSVRSGLSAQWFQTPKERLGFGGRMWRGSVDVDIMGGGERLDGCGGGSGSGGTGDGNRARARARVRARRRAWWRV